MYFLPLACLAGLDNTALKDRIFTAWAAHMRALHLGQAMDIAWHRDFHSLPGLDEYDRMCRLKTGCLARLAAVLGVYVGSSAREADFSKERFVTDLADTFAEAAEQLGVGFQILDDVKNLDAGVPGKKRGDDIVEGKKSLPVLLFLHRYPEKRDFAARCFAAARSAGVEAPEVEEFILCLKNSGVLEEARDMGQKYIQNSIRLFSAPQAGAPREGTLGISLNEEGQKLLAGLANLLV
jgi:octaprenyl-diphosphate synthase